MVKRKENVERTARLQGKLKTIKKHTDWLLGLKAPFFSLRALYKAIDKEDWEVDWGNDKVNMRSYLLSVEQNPAESEERREKARKLRDGLDADTEVNREVRNTC